jgi:phosphonoacetate hydrolase
VWLRLCNCKIRGFTLGYPGFPPLKLRVNHRDYRWPEQPLVVVCLDGSSFDYLQETSARGMTPFLTSLVDRGQFRMVDAAMPTFTNPNNISIVTGVPPSQHGISGNSFLDRATGRPVMMNNASLLRAETIPAAFARAGAKVAIITAKDKLRHLLGAGLEGICHSAEQKGQSVYSAALSEYVLRRGVELMRSIRPSIMYLSTSDYVQHSQPPGSGEANRFYAAIDYELAELDRTGAIVVITADHGMNAKTDEHGSLNAVFLQTLLDGWFGPGATTVILPISDPYVRHHGSLGSFATVYLTNGVDSSVLVRRLSEIAGIELVLERRAACRRFELPYDLTGDVVVCADVATVLGARPDDHDLSALSGPLRSHGGLAEREVPMLFNRRIALDREARNLRNYDAFWVGLNCTAA